MDTSLGEGLESLIPDKQPEDTPVSLPSDAQDADIVPPLEEQQPPEDTIAHGAEAPVAPLSDVSLSASRVNVFAEQVASVSPAARSYQDNFVPRKSDAVFWIEIEKIEPNPFQPRREFEEGALRDLASSIREYGMLQPVLVTKREIETPNGLDVTDELIAGERRWRAS